MQVARETGLQRKVTTTSSHGPTYRWWSIWRGSCVLNGLKHVFVWAIISNAQDKVGWTSWPWELEKNALHRTSFANTLRLHLYNCIASNHFHGLVGEDTFQVVLKLLGLHDNNGWLPGKDGKRLKIFIGSWPSKSIQDLTHWADNDNWIGILSLD